MISKTGSFLALLSILSYATTQPSNALPIIACAQQALNPNANLSKVSFTNNVPDLATLVHMEHEHLEELEEMLKKATVRVNNTLITPSSTKDVTVINNEYTVTITLDAHNTDPFLKLVGIYKFIAYFFEIQISFTARLEPEQNEIEILYPLVNKLEEWQKKTPTITLSYRPPMTTQVVVKDFGA